jgi:hypothetical protein
VNFDEEAEEVILELQKLNMLQHDAIHLNVGDIVQWAYEWIGDPSYGRLYMVIGRNSEKAEIIVTRGLSSPHELKEFHISQLTKV